MKTRFVPTTQKVNRYTRAGKQGKMITCPKCNESVPVYHFGWSALGCIHCNAMINKYEWILEVQ